MEEAGVDAGVRELPDSTRSAADAATAIGCDVRQIVKSLVFRASSGDRPVLVLVCGSDRVDTERLAAQVGGPVERASPEFVRDRTGFAIGGVAPVGHSEPLETLIDERLLGLELVWAAAGTPHAVFSIAPGELQRAAAARVVRVAAGIEAR
jgi:prolyl-tRNA editing enzyme YbaK/EbsC (Cys-tRNA(Pro) deacylase)